MSELRTTHRTCPLCEATCGLELTTRGREVVAIRGDREDTFSAGFICPKGPALKELDADPDRLRTPMIRRGSTWQRVTWDEAFGEIDRQLTRILGAHGRDAVAIYIGNPTAHELALSLYGRVLIRALGSKNVYSASTVDQMPKQVSVGLVFGTATSFPVPDLDRTRHLLILGADPVVSNGSLMTAPDMKGRLRAIRARGGKVIVVDPRRSRTAEEADEHHFIRPGTDAHLLFALVETLFAEKLVKLGRLAEHTSGVDQVRELARPFTPEAVAPVCGVAADTIRRLARELAASECAAVYGRVGTCQQEFGTVASWLVDVLNVLTGNLDRPGGVMFPKAPAGAPNTYGQPGRGRGVRLGRHRSRVRGVPEALGELPCACLAEEIETPGDGQVRALVTIAGNPVLSTPNGARLARALASLEFMVSLDIYLNETTRHAHVVLPGLSPLEQSHANLIFAQLSVRNVAKYSPAVFAPPADQLPDWQSLLRLAGIVTGQGATADLGALDDFVATQQAHGVCAHPALKGREPADILAAVAPRQGPERLLDLMLRSGPYGDLFGARPDGLSLATLEASPHGVDLGPLAPRVPEMLRTPTGKIELAPEPLVADVARLRDRLARTAEAPLVLIGRRQLRSNNSWMHNVPSLVSGKPRCTAQLHPTEAARLGLADGQDVRLTSRVGTIELPVEVTETVMPGVVSVPHGWGHGDGDGNGTGLSVAARHAGVNCNRLTDEADLDPLSGNAVLNGVRVRAEPTI